MLGTGARHSRATARGSPAGKFSHVPNISQADYHFFQYDSKIVNEYLTTLPSPSAALPAVPSSFLCGGAFVARADFCSYASLYHQKQMLTDHRRMQAYYSGERSDEQRVRSSNGQAAAASCFFFFLFFFSQTSAGGKCAAMRVLIIVVFFSAAAF